MADAHLRRVMVGFRGGQTVPLRVPQEGLDQLMKALGGTGWHELRGEDGDVLIDIGEVVYVRTESEDSRVGF